MHIDKKAIPIEHACVGEATASFPPFSDAKMRAVEDFEIDYLHRVLKASGGNISEASRRAELDRSNFRRLLRRYGISHRP